MDGAKILVDTRDKLVLDNRTVTFPILSVFDGATFEITTATMNENRDEEHRIEIWDDRCPTDDRTPAEGHSPVSDVVL